jgi:GDP-L-fucose synthase
MKKESKIYISGHTGMVGSAILRALQKEGYNNIIFRTSKELDLRNQKDTEEFFEKEKPEYVFLASAKVGGILANNIYPADFMYDNIMIEMNVINSAYKNNVSKLLFLGSSCIYPKLASQPISEDSLLTGSLEPTNEAYALAKISGLKYCEYLNRQYKTNFITAMPTNLYGINDNYHPENSHVLPALIRKFHEAKQANAEKVVVWGTGNPKREFMFVDDLADACIYLMHNYEGDTTVNLGTGKDVTIKELALLISKIVDFKGTIEFDTSKPDGTPRKLLNVEKLASLGWKYKTELEEGVRITYSSYLDTKTNKNR